MDDPRVSVGFEVVWAHRRSVRCTEDGDFSSCRESNPGVLVAVLTALLLDRTKSCVATSVGPNRADCRLKVTTEIARVAPFG
jgi:hypothetical protein